MSKWRMWVYLSGHLIVVETNKEFAVPYWAERKRKNDNIRIEIEEV